MPPRTRAARPAQPKTAPPDPVKADGELCTKCWPKGWPTEETHTASCIHGTWAR